MSSVGESGESGIVAVGNEMGDDNSILVGKRIVAWISNDTETWTRGPDYFGFLPGSDESVVLRGATRFQDKIMAVTFERGINLPPPANVEAPGTAQVLVSENGLSWNFFVADSGVYPHQSSPWQTQNAFGPMDIATSGEAVVIAGSDFGAATTWRSTDGQNWEEVYRAQPYYVDQSQIYSIVRITTVRL